MEAIYPICEETVSPYIGRHVCAVLNDGTYTIGKLCGCQNGGILIDGAQGQGVINASNVTDAQKKIKSCIEKINTSAFFNPFFFPFASLAFLFAFPFFFNPFFI